MHVCVSLYTTVINNTAQNSSDYFFPPNLQTIITAQMLSILSKGKAAIVQWLVAAGNQ